MVDFRHLWIPAAILALAVLLAAVLPRYAVTERGERLDRWTGELCVPGAADAWQKPGTLHLDCTP